jgi:hypothetical protein
MGDQELEAVVQRMIDAGESEENIGRIVDNWDALQASKPAKEPAQRPVEAASMTPPESAMGEGAIASPGALTALGVGAGTAMRAAPAVLSKVGGMMEKANKVPKALGSALGASTGAMAGSAVLPGFGTYAGMGVGGQVGYEAAKKALPAVHKAGETLKLGAQNAGAPYNPVWPTMGASAKSVSGLAKLLGTVGKAAGPVGAGLTILDLIQTFGPKMAELAKRSNAMGTPQGAIGDGGSPDDEAKIQELLARMGPVASH